eukprot:2807473-Prymnesium_polylepis.1
MHDPGRSIGPTFSQHGATRKVAVFFLISHAARTWHNRAKARNVRTSPTRTTGGGGGPRQSGLHFPTTLASHAGAFGPPRAPHPALPALTKSSAHRADRVDRRDHKEGGSHERRWLHRSPRALAAAPPGIRA